MDDSNDRLPTEKRQPLSTTDKLLIGVLILLVLATFPILWRVYRFVLPIAVVGFIVYFAIRFSQLGKTTGTIPGQETGAWKRVLEDFLITLSKKIKPVVITTIVVMMFLVGATLGYQYLSKGNSTSSQLARMAQSIEKYNNELKHYPVSLAELIGNDPIKRAWWQDAWGNSIVYTVTKNGAGFTLQSPGQDGKLGSGDDIVLEK